MERDQALKFMHDLLRLMSSKKGSDLFITAGFPPAIKIDGRVTPVSNQVLTTQHTAELARSIMNDRQAAEFEASKECNFAISPTGIGRFRVNAFIQQGRVGVICRTINMTIPTLDDLNLPPVLKDVAMTKRGLVIFVGGTGTGKAPPWPPWWITATRTATATSSPSKTPSSTCTSTRTASSPSGKWGWIPMTGVRP